MYITNNYYNWKGGDTYAKFREFDRKAKYDIIFLGSSRAYRGYSPFLFANKGYSAFNLGTSAQSIKNSYFVLKNYISKENCNLLILDIFAGSFTPNQLESSSDLIQNIGDLSSASEISLSYSDIRTFNILALRMLNEKDSPYFTKDDYSGKGYSATTQLMSEQLKQKFVNKDKIEHRKFQLDEEQLAYFIKISALVKDRQIRTVFVYSPVSWFYNQSAHSALLSEIKPILKANDQPFYDFSQCDSIETVTHFYDESHLNQAGVEVFNRQLLSKLTNDKILNTK